MIESVGNIKRYIISELNSICSERSLINIRTCYLALLVTIRIKRN